MLKECRHCGLIHLKNHLTQLPSWRTRRARCTVNTRVLILEAPSNISALQLFTSLNEGFTPTINQREACLFSRTRIHRRSVCLELNNGTPLQPFAVRCPGINRRAVYFVARNCIAYWIQSPIETTGKNKLLTLNHRIAVNIRRSVFKHFTIAQNEMRRWEVALVPVEVQFRVTDIKIFCRPCYIDTQSSIWVAVEISFHDRRI
mmetsp:Transcript_11890/g.17066  ORF Transcript_11890/g.17066 Transcript_11890/m.17066 type:complete len:203 (-) Transcript_11890:329-937(-)